MCDIQGIFTSGQGPGRGRQTPLKGTVFVSATISGIVFWKRNAPERTSDQNVRF